jgi:WD40 repeat protein
MVLASEDAGVGRGVVFVSYSHADVIWMQRLEVLLKPLLDRRQLSLWSDRRMRAGDAWSSEIERAIEKSHVGLLLVSADFLASDYIVGTELPALRRHGARLAPVLVGDCLWRSVPELAELQWLHDPERDGPLNSDVGDPSQRDRRIREICERLLHVLPEAERSLTLRSPERQSERVRFIPLNNRVAALSDVPMLPPGYVPRDSLAEVIDAVSEGSTVSSNDLTGHRVGLYGYGGMGKSVLASSVARDERIRRRFPDGIFWITVGERPDLLLMQLDLMRRLESVRPSPRTVIEAVRELRSILLDRHVLLIVDDVWSDAAAQAFNVVGPAGCVLYTSRDEQIVESVGAYGVELNALSSDEARALALGVMGIRGPLPEVADRALLEVGRVPLAVALVAAAARGGRPWRAVARELVKDADVYGDHPYSNTFRALRIAISELPDHLASALLSLAVFSPDARIPMRVVAHYWAHTRNANLDDTMQDLERMAGYSLLRYEDDAISFHDLQHGYLLLHARELAVLHAELLNAYRKFLFEDGLEQWWQLPQSESYISNNLVAHLAGAGERRSLVATVSDPAYLARRIAGHGAHAAYTDLGRAQIALPGHATILWWRGWLTRHSPLFDRLLEIPLGADKLRDVVTSRVAATMQAWLLADPSRPKEVEVDRLSRLLVNPCLKVSSGLTSPNQALRQILASGFSGGIGAIAWSPNGAFIATGGANGQLLVWDIVSRVDPVELNDPGGQIRSVAWSPDGGLLATGGRSGHVLLWQPFVATEPISVLTSHDGTVHAVAWSPDGNQLATAGHDRRVLIWEPDRAVDPVAVLTGHTDVVRAVSWAPDSRCLASGGYDGRIFLWNIAAPDQPAATLTGHASWIAAIAWSPVGGRIASGGPDHLVLIWDPEVDDAPVATLVGHTHQVETLAWAPDGRRLATGGVDGQVLLWVPEISGAPTGRFAGSTGWVGSVAWSPDGTYLASDGGAGRLLIWDPSEAEHTRAQTGHSSWIGSLAWRPDGSRLATGGNDRRVLLWEPSRTADPVMALDGNKNWVDAVAWSSDGSRLATGSSEGQVLLWSPELNDRPTAELAAQTTWVNAVAWRPGTSHLAIGGNGGLVQLWDVDASDEPILSLIDYVNSVNSVAWSPDGSILAVGGNDGRVVLWTPGSDRKARVLFKDESRAVRTLAWSRTGVGLIASGTDGLALLWNNPSELQDPISLDGHSSSVNAVAWSPGGQHFATADDSGILIVRNRDGHECASIVLQPVGCLDWSTSFIAAGQWGHPAILELTEGATCSAH